MRAPQIFCAYPMQKIALIILVPILSVGDQRGASGIEPVGFCQRLKHTQAGCAEYSVHFNHYPLRKAVSVFECRGD
jgi:hypothetical protein